MKKTIFFFLFIGALFSLPVCVKRATDGFRLVKIHLDFPFCPEWEATEEPNLGEILKQPFRYMGKGAQCYVFSGGDYVIKLFRYDQPLNPARKMFRSLFGKKKKRTSAESKVRKVFNACKIAFENTREETGLVYIHLNLTEGKLPILKVRDSLGRPYKISLDKTRFVVQRKAEPFRASLKRAIESGDELAVKRRIDSFVGLLFSRTGKGIANSDPNLSRNFGFVGERAVEFDFGNFYQSSALELPAQRKKEVERYAHRLRRWLKREAPEWIGYLDEAIRVNTEETSRPLS